MNKDHEDGWREGYRKGYQDGLKDGKVVNGGINPELPYPFIPSQPYPPNDIIKQYNTCYVCGLDLSKATSYCCAKNNCPSKANY